MGAKAESAVKCLAESDRHILILVARFRGNCDDGDEPGHWQCAFPVQLFASGPQSGRESEVLVPPFVQYVFEPKGHSSSEPLELSNAQPELEEVVSDVGHRWRMPLDIYAKAL